LTEFLLGFYDLRNYSLSMSLTNYKNGKFSTYFLLEADVIFLKIDGRVKVESSKSKESSKDSQRFTKK